MSPHCLSVAFGLTHRTIVLSKTSSPAAVNALGTLQTPPTPVQVNRGRLPENRLKKTRLQPQTPCTHHLDKGKIDGKNMLVGKIFRYLLYDNTEKEMTMSNINRREFLKKMGRFSAVAGSVAVFGPIACYSDYEDGYGDYLDGYTDYYDYGDGYADGYGDSYADGYTDGYVDYVDYADGYADYYDYSDGYGDYYDYSDGYGDYFDYADYSDGYTDYIDYADYADYYDYSDYYDDYGDSYDDYGDYGDYFDYSDW
jgi:hypothetical protein